MNIIRQNILFEHLSKYDNIVWDWNGTLLNDKELSLEILQTQQKKCQAPLLGADEYLQLFSFPIKEFYEKIGFDLDKYPFEGLAAEFFRLYEESFFKSKLFEGTVETLESLSAIGKKQFIVSAAEKNYLKMVVNRCKISHFFIEICGVENDLGETKKAVAEDLVKKFSLQTKETIFVGDTDHDLEVAQAVGAESLLVADGHQSFSRLKQRHHFVLESRYTHL